MSWEAYWAPNLVQWIVGGAITAVVGAVIGILVRRWFNQWLQQLFGEQQQTKHLAEAAATRSLQAVNAALSAVDGADKSKDSARAAADSARATNEAVVWLATELGKANDRSEVLAEKTNRLVGALAMERARQPVSTDTDSGLTVTGKHRLHTALIDTGQILEPVFEPDPEQEQEQPW